MNYVYELEIKVRDYECDMQGIVNNANYQHYTEHARHEWLTSRGISFAQLHSEGIDPVVARLQMKFSTPLRSGDTCVCRLALRREGIKYVFLQDLFRKSDGKLSVRAVVDVVCLINGRMSDYEPFNKLFQSEATA